MESSLSSPDSVESRRRVFPTRSPSPTPVALSSQSLNLAGSPVAEPKTLETRGRGSSSSTVGCLQVRSARLRQIGPSAQPNRQRRALGKKFGGGAHGIAGTILVGVKLLRRGRYRAT